MREEIARYEVPATSLITWMEIMTGAEDGGEGNMLHGFLQRFRLLPPSQDVAERAVSLRKQFRIRIPDAIIWASAEAENTLLVTRNTRDFPEDHPAIRVPYMLYLPIPGTILLCMCIPV